jgi:hypothetical protein
MRRFLSKKAEFSIMVAVLITLVVGMTFLVIGYQINKRSKNMDDDEKCRLSIFANTQIGKVRQGSVGFMDFPVAFECPRKSIKVVLEDVEKYNRVDDDLFKTIVAEEVKGCWGKVGSGKLDPFKRSTTVDEKFCMVCSEFYIDSELAEQIARQDYMFKGFHYWAAAHKLPGIKTSLYEFLKGTRPTAELLRTLKAQENSSESSMDFVNTKYVVVWRVDKFERGWWETVGMVVGGAVLVTAGILVFPVTATAGAVVAGTALTVGTIAGIATAGTLAVGGLGTATIGFINDVSGTDDLKQSVMITPESMLSESFDFGDGESKEFCTVMIN